MRGEGSAAGKEGLVGKFHPLGKYAMKPTNVHSDWMSNAFFGLCIKLHYTDPESWDLIFINLCLK